VVHAARVYLVARNIAEHTQPCRFDVIAVEGQRITHLKDAFEATSA
jgi:Holliday junction resolvase-like predicted endonuclease